MDITDVAGVTDITDVADVTDITDITDITDVAGFTDVTDITGGTVRHMAYRGYSTFLVVRCTSFKFSVL